MASSSSMAVLVLVLVVLTVLAVERLLRDLRPALVEELAVQRVAAVAVGREQREAILDEDALVDGEIGEFGGHDRPAGHERATPDKRHVGPLTRLAAPGP